HPGTHSALLSNEQWQQLAVDLGADASDPWARFEEDSPEGQLCRRAAERLRRGEIARTEPPAVPRDIGRSHAGVASTQQAFGRFFMELAPDAPELAALVVSVSPDV